MSESPSDAHVARLARFGLNADAASTVFDGGGHGPIRLDSDAVSGPFAPKIVSTNDLDEMRSWHASQGAKVATVPADVSAGFHNDEVSDDDEKARLMRFGYEYVFHGQTPDGAGVMKADAEQQFAPFKTAVFAGQKIVVRPGSPLIVSGSIPVALVYDEMDIYPGGQVQIFAPGSMTITTVKKLS